MEDIWEPNTQKLNHMETLEGPLDATEIKAKFAYEIDMRDQSIIIWKDKKAITLSYWECLLLHRILDRNINN